MTMLYFNVRFHKERLYKMNKRFALSAAILSCLSVMTTPAAKAKSVPQTPLIATIDTQQTSDPVSKYIYGMFIEHIGNTMYGTIWSEMVDDRKFFNDIKPEPPVPQPASQGPFQPRRKWYTLGSSDVVVMDTNQPYVGEQSPKIEIDPITPHGIRQDGFGLAKGKKYTGHIILKSDHNANVKVSLVWGDGLNDNQTVTFDKVSGNYKSYQLSFVSPVDVRNAKLIITATGNGSFHVGLISLMPADNIDGFRADTIARMREIKAGMWRFGGNYISGYTWYNAIGDRDKRAPELDRAWYQVQSNDLGLDEFAKFCKLIDVEPYISVNAGFGDAHSAAEEVEYMNGSPKTRMGALRAKNGQSAPYNVKYWSIGNEPWGDWQLGRTDLKYFVIKHNEFAKAMRKADPSIQLIACGQMLDIWALPKDIRPKYNDDTVKTLFGTEYDWTGGFLKNCWGNFEGISEHVYSSPPENNDLESLLEKPVSSLTPDDMANLDAGLLQYEYTPADAINGKAAQWEGYQKQYPAMVDQKIYLALDEYAYFGRNFRHGSTLMQAFAYAAIFNAMMNHSSIYTIASHTMGTSTLEYAPGGASLNVLGEIFKLYSNTFPGTLPVKVAIVSPGESRNPLNVFAALSANRKQLIVSVVNATLETRSLTINAEGTKIQGSSSLTRLTGTGLDAANHFGQQPQVEVKEIPMSNADGTISVAPISVNIYRFSVIK